MDLEQQKLCWHRQKCCTGANGLDGEGRDPNVMIGIVLCDGAICVFS